MTKKRRRWQILVLLLVFLPLGGTRNAAGTEVQAVETTGSIGFTGTYVPVGQPDPTPPKPGPPVIDSAKPGGSLPQTNDAHQPWLVWLGIILLSLSFLYWNQKKYRQTHEESRKNK